MTERTIRTLAKEYAGQFYEMKRSNRFRSKDSLTRAKTLKQLPNGSVVEVTVVVPFFKAYPNSKVFSKSHWPLFYEAARKSLVTMLALPNVSDELKEGIHAALVEDRQNEYKAPVGGQTLIQRSLELE